MKSEVHHWLNVMCKIIREEHPSSRFGGQENNVKANSSIPFQYSIPLFHSIVPTDSRQPSQVCLKPLQMGGIESVECSTGMEWWNGIVERPHFSHLEGKEASLVSE